MATQDTFDLLVIGAGPGGYVAAIRAAQLGLRVACVDEHRALGGTCLRVGCIPSKALLESSERYESTRHELKDHGVEVEGVALDLEKMLARKDKVVKALTGGVDSLFKKNKIAKLTGRAAIRPDKTVVVEGDSAGEYAAENLLVATGSTPATLPGVDLSHDLIDDSTDALSYEAVPEHLAVIGAGYIGLELGSVWRRLGAKVTVIEYLDRALPLMDDNLAKEAEKTFKKQGIEFVFGAKVTGVKPKSGKPPGVTVSIDGRDDLDADRVLVAVGRVPNTDGLGLDELGVERTERGHVVVDDRFQTTADGVYAIGDCIEGPALAHKAEDEGVAFAEMLVTGTGHVDYETIPAVVYTHPEIASVGKTEQALKDAGVAYRKGVFPFIANGRARALGDTGGSVIVLADEATDRVLGVHIIGPRAGDLIAECATAMAFGASSEDIARACHAHPTLAETVKEASLAALGRAIHI